MKEYNAKMIVDNDELKILFECDKEKNKDCKRIYCGNGECEHTTDSRYMKAKHIIQEGINLDINVNKEQLDDTIDELKELNDTRPNITIRNNENVYVTINYINNKEAE